MFKSRLRLRLSLLLLLLLTSLFGYVISEVAESWLEYKTRMDKKRSRSNLLREQDKNSQEMVHSRRKRSIGFPTGSTFTFTPVLCIPVISLGDFSGALDIELPFTITLPNSTQVTYAFGRSNDDRIGVYSVIIDALNRFGLKGKSCLLRAICEIAETPLKHDGLMGEIINIVLGISPTDTNDPMMRDYVEADYNGRAYGDCWSLYPDCPISIFRLEEG